MWHVYWFVNIPIRKRLIFVPIQIGVWYILAKNIAFWLVDLMQPFFRAWRDFTASQRWFLKQQFCLTDLKVRFWYATMNAWIQIWVQGEMCGNNTIKLEWHTYIDNACINFPLNSIGKKIHTLPRCGLVTIQIVRHILCSNNFWCGFVCQGVFFHTNAVLKSCTFYTGSIVALLDLIFKLQYLMNYSSDFNNFCRFQLLAVCTTLL